MEKFVNKEKKYIKEIEVSSLAIKFGGSLLDFRNENGKMCYCLMSAIIEKINDKTKK